MRVGKVLGRHVRESVVIKAKTPWALGGYGTGAEVMLEVLEEPRASRGSVTPF